MEIFMNLKRLLRLCGHLKFNNPMGELIAYFLRIVEFSVVFYGFITTMWIVILTNEPILEKGKSLETAEALVYTLALHVILTLWPRQFFDMIDNINSKILERKAVLITRIYDDTNYGIEQIAKKMLSSFKIVFPMFVVPLLTQSYINYYVNGMGEDSFQVSYEAAYFYNWRTPSAYFFTSICLLMQYASGALVYSSVIILFFGICKFLIAFCVDFTQYAHEMDDELLDAVRFGREISEETQHMLTAKLKHIVVYHCDINELADQTSIIFEGVLATLIFEGGLYWGSNLFEIHMCMQNNDLLALLNAFSRTAIFVPILLLMCVFGEMVTTAFGELNGTIYELSWHLWPTKLQKHLVSILIKTQKPVTFKGLFTMDCSRDTFKRVINTGYTAFMTLRRM